MALMHGGKIAFYRGDVKVIIDDVKMARPNGFCSVPRLLNRVHDKVGSHHLTSNLPIMVTKVKPKRDH